MIGSAYYLTALQPYGLTAIVEYAYKNRSLVSCTMHNA